MNANNINNATNNNDYFPVCSDKNCNFGTKAAGLTRLPLFCIRCFRIRYNPNDNLTGNVADQIFVRHVQQKGADNKISNIVAITLAALFYDHVNDSLFVDGYLANCTKAFWQEIEDYIQRWIDNPGILNYFTRADDFCDKGRVQRLVTHFERVACTWEVPQRFKDNLRRMQKIALKQCADYHALDDGPSDHDTVAGVQTPPNVISAQNDGDFIAKFYDAPPADYTPENIEAWIHYAMGSPYLAKPSDFDHEMYFYANYVKTVMDTYRKRRHAECVDAHNRALDKQLELLKAKKNEYLSIGSHSDVTAVNDESDEEEEKIDVPNIPTSNDVGPIDNIDDSIDVSSSTSGLPCQPMEVRHTPNAEQLEFVKKHNLNIQFVGTSTRGHPMAYLERIAACKNMFLAMRADGIRNFVDVGSDAVRTRQILSEIGWDAQFLAMMPYVLKGDRARFLAAKDTHRPLCHCKLMECKHLITHQEVNSPGWDKSLARNHNPVSEKIAPIMFPIYDALFFCHSIYYCDPEEVATRLEDTNCRTAYVLAHRFDVMGTLCGNEIAYYTDVSGKIVAMCDGETEPYVHNDPAWLQAGAITLTKWNLEISTIGTIGSTHLYKVLLAPKLLGPGIYAWPLTEVLNVFDQDRLNKINQLTTTTGSMFDPKLVTKVLPHSFNRVSFTRIYGKTMYVTSGMYAGEPTVITLPAGLISTISCDRIGKSISPESYQTAIRQAKSYMRSIRMPANFKNLAIITAAAVGLYAGAMDEAKSLALITKDHKGLQQHLNHALTFGDVDDEYRCWGITPSCFFPGTKSQYKPAHAEAWGTSLMGGVAANVPPPSLPLSNTNMLPPNTFLKTPDDKFKLSSAAVLTADS